MIPPELVGLLGSIASIAGLGTSLAQWWTSRRREKKKAGKDDTLREYLEWLRRNDHADLVARLESSDETLSSVEGVIGDLLTRSADDVAAIMAKLERQDRKLDAIAHDAGETRDIAKRIEDRPRKDAEEFEKDYLEAVVSSLDEMELFGIDPRIDPAARKQKLSIAYLVLNLTSERGKEQAPKAFAELLGSMDPAKRNKVLIRGDAGSGKTTLLKWAAIESAKWALNVSRIAAGDSVELECTRDEAFGLGIAAGLHRMGLSRSFDRAMPDFEDGLRSIESPRWRAKIPLFVPLRKCRDGQFPSCAAFPALVNESLRKPPDNWVESVLKAGRGLVMIDGVDEVPPGWRKTVDRGIDDLLNLYGKKGNLFVVTSRPLVEDPGWIQERGFQEARIAPMSETDRNELIRLWHKAVAEQLRELGCGKEAGALPEKQRFRK